MNFDNKIVLVTGANRGIGLAIVESLLKRGVTKVYAAARNPNNVPDLGDNRVIPLQLDITDSEQVHTAAKIANDVEVVINNAGAAAFTSLLDGPMELIKKDMEINYFGTLNMVRSFVPVLESKQNAGIINVVTIAAFVNFPNIGGYSASKSALFSLSQGIRIELEPKGISVQTINPGPVDTDLARDMPLDKVSPESVAENALDAAEKGEQDIFPDPMSQQLIDVWKTDYMQLERMVGEMHNAH